MSQMLKVYNYHSKISGRGGGGHVARNFRILTSGGPPRNIVPCLPTIILSSAIAGTYAPPAVQDPITTAIYQENKKHKLMSCPTLKNSKGARYYVF